ncbi:MAG TPA: hypothetical protein VF329_04285 [Gammaproteobacteria bacterium]
MSPDELHYLDVIVPRRNAERARLDAKFARERDLDLVYQSMTEGHVTPEAVAKHRGWTVEKARFLLNGAKA